MHIVKKLEIIENYYMVASSCPFNDIASYLALNSFLTSILTFILINLIN